MYLNVCVFGLSNEGLLAEWVVGVTVWEQREWLKDRLEWGIMVLEKVER